MEWLIQNWEAIAGTAAVAILLAERIARLTPTETDNRWLKTVKRLADVIGINVPDNPGKKKET